MTTMNEIQRAMTWGTHGLDRHCISLNAMAKRISEAFDDVSWCPAFGRNIVCLEGDGSMMCEIVWMNKARTGMRIREAACNEPVQNLIKLAAE